jgi:transposase InsO family protein
MPWKEVSVMSQRLEFVQMASTEQANIRELCRHFNISAPTAYKWLHRFKESGQQQNLMDRSRRPHHSPRRTAAEIEQLVIELRTAHPAWGGRKIHARMIALGRPEVPQPSTITAILKRHQLIDPSESAKHQSFCRFEHPRPNDLWQMDFKGDFALDDGRCFPLTVLDDHSRFALGLLACPGPSTMPTQTALRAVFRRYGLPARMTMDNGSPWGSSNKPGAHTHFTIWLLRLGVAVSHSRPYHPQTQGKDERFHRTLQAELLRYATLRTLAQCQLEFDRWRDLYNCQRPHEALGMQVPASRYSPSRRPFPEVLPPVDYDTSDIVRKVRGWGHIRYHDRDYFIGQAFKGLHVALRYTATEGVLDVYFCQHRLFQINVVASTKRV